MLGNARGGTHFISLWLSIFFIFPSLDGTYYGKAMSVSPSLPAFRLRPAQFCPAYFCVIFQLIFFKLSDINGHGVNCFLPNSVMITWPWLELWPLDACKYAKIALSGLLLCHFSGVSALQSSCYNCSTSREMLLCVFSVRLLKFSQFCQK